MTDDSKLHEMTCNPASRGVLVTDALTPGGKALVRALVGAGAAIVWAGYTESAQRLPSFDELEPSKRVTLLPLDITRSDSVREAAAAIGMRVDILINNAEVHSGHGLAAGHGVEAARVEMEVNYFGLLHATRAVLPHLKARGGRLVNIASMAGLSGVFGYTPYCAAKHALVGLSDERHFDHHRTLLDRPVRRDVRIDDLRHPDARLNTKRQQAVANGRRERRIERHIDNSAAGFVRGRVIAAERKRRYSPEAVAVLDADRELLTAQDSLALAQADTARAAVAVFRSLGGGW